MFISPEVMAERVNWLLTLFFLPHFPGSTMDKYKGLTDDELLALLKKCRIRHGPIVGME